METLNDSKNAVNNNLFEPTKFERREKNRRIKVKEEYTKPIDKYIDQREPLIQEEEMGKEVDKPVVEEEEEDEEKEEEEQEEEDEEEEEEEEEDEQEDEEEEEEEDISPIFYKYNETTYTVDNANFLQRNFDTIETVSMMNICIYKCIRSGCTPYLLYLMVYDNKTNTLIFPKYTISSVSEGSEEELESGVLDEFKRILFDIYPPSDTNSLNPEESVDIYTEEFFRGFFENKNKDITMVYDATRITVPLADDKEYYWVTPYEMFASKSVHGITVDPKVLVEIASADGSLKKEFYHLKDVKANTLVKDPYILFLCKPDTSSGILSTIGSTFGFSPEYENIESVDSEEQVRILYPRIKHDKIGTYTFFSSSSNAKNAERFVVFVDIDGLSPLYLEPGDIDKLNHLYDPGNMELSTAITFMNGSQQIWCIKSPFYFSEIKEVHSSNEDIYDEIEPIVPIGTEETVDTDIYL